MGMQGHKGTGIQGYEKEGYKDTGKKGYSDVLIQKQSLQTRQLHFDGYSVNFAYKPIGQRGDPLKIIVYRVFIDIARENEPTFPCTCWVRAVAVLSAISAKLDIFQALCIATASGGLQSQHTEIQTCSSL